MRRWYHVGKDLRDLAVRVDDEGVARGQLPPVVTSPWFLVNDPYFRSYLMACYQPPKIFSPPESGPGSGLFDVFVFRHTPGNSPCRAPRR